MDEPAFIDMETGRKIFENRRRIAQQLLPDKSRDDIPEGMIEENEVMIGTTTDQQIIDLLLYSYDFRRLAMSGRIFNYMGCLFVYSPLVVHSGNTPDSMLIKGEAVYEPWKYMITTHKQHFSLYSRKPGWEPKVIPKYQYYRNMAFLNPPTYDEAMQEVEMHREAFYSDLKEKMKTMVFGVDRYDGFVDTSEYPVNFLHYTVVEVLKARGMSISKFAKSIGISESTIERFWTKPESRPSLGSVVAVCLGLHLPPTTSELFLHEAGYHLRPVPLERAYGAALNLLYTQDMHTCNEVLRRLGVEALTHI